MVLSWVRGYGLVVERVLAKDETGVRFSLVAQVRIEESKAGLSAGEGGGVARLASWPELVTDSP